MEGRIFKKNNKNEWKIFNPLIDFESIENQIDEGIENWKELLSDF